MQTVETLNEGLKRAFTLTIPAKDIAARVDTQLAQVAPQVRMPGFRPGKVPANLVRKMHGSALEQEALQNAVQDGVQQLLAEKSLRPAMQPQVELDEGYAPGKDAEVKVALEVLPQVPEPKIEGLTLERLTVEPDDSAVDAALAQLSGGRKSFEAAEAGRAAQTGDAVIIDFLGKVDGEPFEGGKGEGMQIELGSGQLIPGFEDQLIGAKANDEVTVSVNFPDDYNVAYLKGKPATFDVVVTEVRTPKEAGEPDDDFAKQLGLESLEQLKGLLKGQVEQELNGLTRTHLKRKLLDQLAASHDFEVPPSMVDAEFRQIWAQLEHEAGHAEDPEAAKAEMEAEREDYVKIAERRVRLGLLLSEIGQANGVEVTQQEMNRLVAQQAQQYRGEDQQRFLQYVQQNPMAQAQIRAPLYEEKVVDFLLTKAAITDRTVDRAELEAAIEADEDGHVHGPNCGHDHGDGHVHGPDCDHDHDDGAKKAKPAAAKPAAKKAAAPKKTAAKAEAAEGEAAVEAKPVKKAAPKAKAAADAGEAAEKPKPAAKKPAAKKAKAAD